MAHHLDLISIHKSIVLQLCFYVNSFSMTFLRQAGNSMCLMHILQFHPHQLINKHAVTTEEALREH